MPVIFELRGGMASFSELGVNLYSGCAVGCRYCTDPSLRRTTWERWTSEARPRKNILAELIRDAKKMEGSARDHCLPWARPLSVG